MLDTVSRNNPGQESQINYLRRFLAAPKAKETPYSKPLQLFRSK